VYADFFLYNQFRLREKENKRQATKATHYTQAQSRAQTFAAQAPGTPLPPPPPAAQLRIAPHTKDRHKAAGKRGSWAKGVNQTRRPVHTGKRTSKQSRPNKKTS